MKSNSTKLLILVGIFLLGSIIISQSGLFSHARIDLTENKLFTLNDGTKNILKNIDEKVYLKLYFSDEATKDIPVLRTYRNTVVDILKEMQRYSDDKLELSFIDPKSFSPQEDEASQFGLQALPVGTGGENIFFGLVGENSLDSIQTIPFMQPDRESFLEYDIAQLINNLNHPEKKLVAIMSSIEVMAKFDEIKKEMKPAQVFVTQLQKDYNVMKLKTDTENIDDKIDVLLLIHPKELSDKTLLAIDQFVMKGGRLLVFVDPFSQAETMSLDLTTGEAFQAEKNSDLTKLFKAWNVQYDAKKVLLDPKYSLNIQRNKATRPEQHLAYLAFTNEAFNAKDIIARDLNAVNTAMVGVLAGDNLQPIIQSSKQASTTTTEAVKFLVDPRTLFKNFHADDKAYTIAARLTGTIKTAFPNGIEAIDAMAAKDIIQENKDPKIVLFADTDILFDQMWVKSQNFFGRKVFSAFADNGNMITNLLDNMAGSPDLINIRGRKNSARPFTKVIALQKASDAKFRDQEQVLKQKLRQTEEKLLQIQKQKGQQDRLILSAEQEQEIKKFQQEKLEVRKKLREVRRNLDKDIEDLGTHLKIINIGLIPLLITLIGIFILWFKPKRKGGKYAK